MRGEIGVFFCLQFITFIFDVLIPRVLQILHFSGEFWLLTSCLKSKTADFLLVVRKKQLWREKSYYSVRQR